MGKKLNIIITILIISIIGMIGYIVFYNLKYRITSITLNTKEMTVFIGESKRLEVDILPIDANKDNVFWDSSDSDKAIVSNEGEVFGLSEGEVIITARNKSGKISDTCKINVLKKEITKIEMPESMEIQVGENKKIDVVITPKELQYMSLNWESSDEKIAVVNDGVITGIANGEVEIIAKKDKASSSSKVKIITLVKEVKFNEEKMEIGIDEKMKVEPVFFPVTASNKNFSLESSDSNILEIVNNEIVGKNIGTVTLKVISEDGKKTATTEVSVVKKYKVSYVDLNQSFLIKENSTLDSLPIPTKEKSKFLGWYTEKNNGIKVSESTIVMGDLTLYAHWHSIYKHVFIIGIDGAGAAFSKVDTPNFARIFTNYAYKYDAITEYETYSAENWGSILTGVAYTTHGLTYDIVNTKTRNSKSNNLSVFYYTKKAIPNAKLVSIVNWNPINYGIIETDVGVKKIHGGNDAEVLKLITNYLKNDGAPTLMFVQFDEVDYIGHMNGGFSNQYYNAIKVADTMIGSIYDTINSLGVMDDTLFIVVADHGMAKNGHGKQSVEESSAMLAVKGYSVNKTRLDNTVHNRDVAAIVLDALGIDKPKQFISKVPNNLFKN